MALSTKKRTDAFQRLVAGETRADIARALSIDWGTVDGIFQDRREEIEAAAKARDDAAVSEGLARRAERILLVRDMLLSIRQKLGGEGFPFVNGGTLPLVREMREWLKLLEELMSVYDVPKPRPVSLTNAEGNGPAEMTIRVIYDDADGFGTGPGSSPADPALPAKTGDPGGAAV